MLLFLAMFLFPHAAWADEISISSAAEWNQLVQKVNSGADDYLGDTVTITANLDFRSYDPIKPAGTADHPFRGILNGNNHTFSHFTIDVTDSADGVGLIGYAEGPIDGVIVDVMSFININEAAGGRIVKNVGMVVGHTTSTVTNCNNRYGSITIVSAVPQIPNTTDSSGNVTQPGTNFLIANVGGVAGQALGNVSGCRNGGTITVTESSTPVTENEQNNLVINVGGVVGSLGTVDSSQTAQPAYQGNWNPPEGYDTTHGALSRCTNTGTITVNTPSESGLDRFGQQMYAQGTNVGGIAGYSRGSISDCVNAGFLNANRSSGVGGIVGGLRSLTTTTSYSGNFSSQGKDDGMVSQEPIVISNCWNRGDVVGFVFPAGIAGRAGSYTTITDCLNGLNDDGTVSNTYVIAERWNKPFPSGIVGGTYGSVSYCANFASVGSGRDYDPASHVFTYGSGYYASGIAGNLSRFTDSSLNPVSPLPELYGCYNVGAVIANANMRQRALVGDNGGFVHDNVALEGCVSTNDLLYGDDDDESESSGGSSTNNMFVTKAQLLGAEFVDEEAGTVALSILNAGCDSQGWANYWVRSNSESLNRGFPVLKKQVTWDATELTAANTTVALKANAEYSGLESIPKVTASLNGATLLQNVDFRVVPQAGATDVTVSTVGAPVSEVPASEMPYSFTIEGVGSYAGTVAAGSYKYGVTRGNLANCVVAIDTKQFNAKAQTLVPSDATVKNLAGGTVDPSEYDIAFTPGDKSLTDGQAINAKKYGVTLTAKNTSEHFYGTNTSGIFNIKPAQIIVSKEGDVSAGNKAEPDGITFTGRDSDEVAWYSLTAHKDVTDDELRTAGAVFPYTGHPIKPTVTGVTLSGTTVDGEIPLVEGRDYRVVYGQTAIDTTGTDGAIQVDNVGKAGTVAYGYIMVRYVAGSNYSNYDVMKFIIDGKSTGKLDLTNALVECPDEVVYESAVGPAGYRPVKVSYAGSELTAGTDYAITYVDNDKVGTASYSITGKGKYEGEVSGTFELVEGEAVTFTYEYNSDKTATVTGMTYNGVLDSLSLEIPKTTTHNGVTYTVTAIGDKAFGSNSASEISADSRLIKSVTIPASVESIGEYAFCTVNIATSDLSEIKSITFDSDSKLKTIGRSAFYKAAITDLTIPASVESIGMRAFRDCANLKTVTFESKSSTLPAINSQAFQNVSGVAATYYDVAKGVDTYVTKTIKSQKWTSNIVKTPSDDDSGSGDDPDPTPIVPAKTKPTVWTRLWGDAGLDTMSKIVDAGKFKSGGVVVLATFDGYWDALTAAGAAGLVEAPVLMSDGASLSSQTRAQLVKLKPKTIFVCGGTVAVSNNVANAAAKAAGGATVVRAAGSDAVGTANEIFTKAKKLGGATWADTAFICTNDGYWDALAAAPISYAKHMPIFLTSGRNAIDSSVLSTMKSGGIKKVYLVGGTAAISNDVRMRLQNAGFTVVDRLWGDDAVETSEAVARCGLKLGMSADKMGVATNSGYWDALSGAALCGKNNSVLVLVGDASSHSIGGFVKSNSNSIISAEIFGGKAVVDAATETALKNATKSIPSTGTQSSKLQAASTSGL